MKEKGTRSTNITDCVAMQRKTNGKGEAWMLHQRDAITTNNDAVQKKKKLTMKF